MKNVGGVYPRKLGCATQCFSPGFRLTWWVAYFRIVRGIRLASLWVLSAWEVVSASAVNSACTVTVLLSGGSQGGRRIQWTSSSSRSSATSSSCNILQAIQRWAISRASLTLWRLDALPQLEQRFRRRMCVALMIGCSGALSQLLVDLMIVDSHKRSCLHSSHCPRQKHRFTESLRKGRLPKGRHNAQTYGDDCAALFTLARNKAENQSQTIY